MAVLAGRQIANGLFVSDGDGDGDDGLRLNLLDDSLMPEQAPRLFNLLDFPYARR